MGRDRCWPFVLYGQMLAQTVLDALPAMAIVAPDSLDPKQ
jgi:hypothetical protein